MTRRPCDACGHRADYHHQMAPHPCGVCDCSSLKIPLLKKPKEIGVAVTPDKYTLPLFEAGAVALICFGCGGHIEPGEMFIKRTYCLKQYAYGHSNSPNKKPFCRACAPFSQEGVS